MINNKKIVKYAGASLFASTLALGAGLKIYDNNVDHTKKICLVTKILNMLPNVENPAFPFGIAYHQIPKMEKELFERGINEVNVTCSVKDEDVNLFATWSDGETYLKSKR